MYFHLYAAQDSSSPEAPADEVPRPYAVRWNSSGEEFQAGDSLDVELTLVGRSLGWAPLVATAFGIAGYKGFGVARHPFRLLRARLRGVGDRRVTLFKDQRFISEIPAGFAPYSLEPLSLGPCEDSATVHLRFITPVQLQKRMNVDTPLRGADILKTAIRRVTAMDIAWSDSGWTKSLAGKFRREIESCQVVNNETSWRHVDRYSMTQAGKLPLFGREGRIALVGVPSGLLPLIRSLEHLHLGRHAVNGLGAIRIEE